MRLDTGVEKLMKGMLYFGDNILWKKGLLFNGP